jgi:hypothetical protein
MVLSGAFDTFEYSAATCGQCLILRPIIPPWFRPLLRSKPPWSNPHRTELPLGHYYRSRVLSSSRLGYPLHGGDRGHACAQPLVCDQVYVHDRAYDDPGRSKWINT